MFAEAPPVEYEKLVKVSRPIADRSSRQVEITAGLAEALQYRPRGQG